MEAQEIYKFDNSIKRLLGMKGVKRLEVENDLTEKILSYDYSSNTPGIRLKFLETKNTDSLGGSWVNYNILIEADKYSDTPEYLEHIFSSISRIVKYWGSTIPLDVIGIQEVSCDNSGFYYILIYILSDGKDKEQQQEDYWVGD